MMRPELRAIVASCLVACVAVLISACIPPGYAQQKWSDYGPNDVLLVGKLELDPPIRSGETDVPDGPRENIKDFYRFSVLANVTDRFDAKETEPPGSLDTMTGAWRLGRMDWAGMWLKVPNQPAYFNHQVFYLKYIPGCPDQRYCHKPSVIVYGEMPGKYRVDIKPGDRAVYMGTIRFKRDKNVHISGVEFRDEFETASKQVTDFYGPGPALVKRFAVVLDDHGNPAPRQPKWVHVAPAPGTGTTAK